jgi:hypothetical protein
VLSKRVLALLPQAFPTPVMARRVGEALVLPRRPAAAWPRPWRA